MAEHSKLRGRRNSLDDELLSLLERLSVVIEARRDACCKRCTSRPHSKVRARSAPRLEPTTSWVPSELPQAKKQGNKLRKSRLEDKAPSPRPPHAKRGEALRSVSVPQLRASVEVKPRRRAAPKPSAKRTETAPRPPPAPPPPPPKRPGSGRRSSRNLLAELYRPESPARVAAPPPAPWEPVTRFAPPPRQAAARAPQADTSEMFYGSPEKPGTCPSCTRAFTEDSIFCRHCGSRRGAERPEPLTTRSEPVAREPVAREAKAEPMNLDNATRQLEQLVQETHQALVRDGVIHGQNGKVPPATPSLDAVDRALEELQRGLLEIDTVLAKPMPEAP